MTPKWNDRFLKLAEHVAGWSKDPSTRVGSVIVRPDKTVAGVGFNGLPRGIEDTDKRLTVRDIKYEMIVHAEMNAILHAREPLHGYTLYVWPMPPCSHCAAAIIQAGISEVISPGVTADRWIDNCRLAQSMLTEAGIHTEWRS